jgi:hypothetical protein
MDKQLALLLLLIASAHAQILRGSTLFGSTACSPTTGHNYTTTFPATENPISECSSWINGNASPQLDWTAIRTTPAFAFGTEASTHAHDDDSTAWLTGTWGNDQEMWGTIVAPTAANTDKEAELRFRITAASHSLTGYEVELQSFRVTGCIIDLVRWNGPLDNFTVLTSVSDAAPSLCLLTGDVARATMIGGMIRVFVNGVEAKHLSATDSTYASGAPGIGTFILSGGGLTNNFGFSAYTATDTPFAYVQSASQDRTSATNVVTMTTTTGHNIWCMAFWANSNAVTIADNVNGGNYTASAGGAVSGASGLSSYKAETFWKLNVTGGSTTITATGTGSVDRGLTCHEFQGPTALDVDTTVKSVTSTLPTSNAASIANAHEYLSGGCIMTTSSNIVVAPWNLREYTNWGQNPSGDTVSTSTGSKTFGTNPGSSVNALCGLTTFK